MADYKETLFDTIEKLSQKVKQVSESTSVRDIYEGTANRAKTYGHAAKLVLDKNSAMEELRKAYAELGKHTYERCKNSPDPSELELFSRIDTLLASIQAMDSEINTIRGDFEASQHVTAEEEILDFDSIVSQTETDGQK